MVATRSSSKTAAVELDGKSMKRVAKRGRPRKNMEPKGVVSRKNKNEGRVEIQAKPSKASIDVKATNADFQTDTLFHQKADLEQIKLDPRKRKEPKKRKDARVPVTSIISSSIDGNKYKRRKKVDTKEDPKLTQVEREKEKEKEKETAKHSADPKESNDQTEEAPGAIASINSDVSLIGGSLLSPESSVESDSDENQANSTSHNSGTPKRKYKIDRENIKINKRIMSKDTEEVIKMFKKFDDEVLTNSDAKARLLSLGFETRKRYITTFKHYIRFCCMKQLDNFFVTGDLMKEFYEEQFDRSTSDKPVIRLRKMDPAFSKLQEINFLVYHLRNKEIPNRQVALDYLVFKDTGKAPSEQKLDRDELRSAEVHKDTKRERSQGEAKTSDPLEPVTKRKKTLKNQLTGSTFDKFQQKFDSKYNSIAKLTKNQALLKLILAMRNDFSAVVDEYTKELAAVKSALVAAESKVAAHHNNNNNSNNNYNSYNSYIMPTNDYVQSSYGSWPTRIPPPTDEPIQIVDMNHDISSVHEILEEWYLKPPSVKSRLERWGLNWVRDEIDFETYQERENIIKFVDLLSNATGDDNFMVAMDCDRYIRDKSVLDEFISEIEMDQESLFKRILRFRKRRN